MRREQVLEFFNNDKSWEKRAEEGIEKYRKGDMTILLKDFPNAEVKIKQVSHEFRYGANIFMLDELESEEKNNLYKKHFAETFNMATLPFYWDATEPEKGKTRYAEDSEKLYRRPPIDLCIEFCQKHNIEPREHALCYEHFFPKWLENATVEEVKEALENRFKEISERYKDKINTIEITNEHGWPKGNTAFYKEPDFISWCYKKAEEYFPENQIVINEWSGACWADSACGKHNKYHSLIDDALKNGARIDAIGLQFHAFFKREDEYKETRPYYSPENLFKQMDAYAQFNKPLQVTEVTIPAYSWNNEDEEIQAEIIKNLYKIWFSHEKVEQIIYWNMVDGYAHVPDADPEKIAATQGDMMVGENYYHGGLLRFDMTPKPAYYTIKNLFEKEWHTEETLLTNERGTVTLRGFFGDYEINVNGKKYQASFLKNSDNKIILTY